MKISVQIFSLEGVSWQWQAVCVEKCKQLCPDKTITFLSTEIGVLMMRNDTELQ
jgi:hypothetical protein